MNEGRFDDRRVYWLWVSMALGAASESLWKLCRGYRSVADFAEAVKACRFSDMSAAQCERAQSRSFLDAEKLIERCADEGVAVVTFRDELYPSRLKRIPNPPPVLFARGDLGRLKTAHAVSVVGTRTPCDYSFKAVDKLCGELAQLGIPVISGAEEGIDLAANKAACDAGGVTAALVGRGILDPKSKGGSLDEIAAHGILLSEYTDSSDFGRVPFDARNRILCGLADAVLFIEARSDSMGLNNVKHAERLNKPVFCVPPADITDARFFGQRSLIRNGAYPAFDATDIVRVLEKIDGSGQGAVKYDDIRDKSKSKTNKSGKMSEKKAKKVSENDQEGLHNGENSVKIDMSGLSQEQKSIVQLLMEKGTLHLNQIAELLEMSMSTAINELTMLELIGTVNELPGKQFELK